MGKVGQAEMMGGAEMWSAGAEATSAPGDDTRARGGEFPSCFGQSSAASLVQYRLSDATPVASLPSGSLAWCIRHQIARRGCHCPGAECDGLLLVTATDPFYPSWMGRGPV
jgi:hypothetical protein